MIKAELQKELSKILESLGSDAAFSLEYPEDPAHGDLASNAALAAAKVLKKNPRVLAQEIADEVIKSKPKYLDRAEVAGPGFINFYLSRKFFVAEVDKAAQDKHFGQSNLLKGQKVMVEYTDPNPFKEFHIGHLMSNAIGESISRLMDFSGAKIKRACYQGDVGLHVAKAIWGMQSVPSRDNMPLQKLGLEAKARYLGHAYSLGAAAYEEPGHKKEIEELNQKIYNRSDNEINKLYDWGREVSLAYFEKIYERLGTKFDHFFFESEMAKPGMEIVKKFLEKGVFERSDGAVVFKGEKFNKKLHTRVYVTSQGIPTYETKELGLHFTKADAYDADLSVVITANEQDGVFQVGLEALRQIDSTLASKVKHLSHGMLRLPSGKMSSRTGDVITADSLINDVASLVEEKIKDRGYEPALAAEIVHKVSIGAIKYSILRQAIGGDIIFDFEKSISFEGDSGPYLQYSLTRAKSALAKAKEEKIKAASASTPGEPFDLERVLYRFPDIVERATREYAPHLLVTFLTELAASFNNFYAKEKIVDSKDAHSPYKVLLTTAFARVMENGLHLLGIASPEKM